jgi:hypothetical protein
MAICYANAKAMQGMSYRASQGPVVSHIGFGISVIIIIIIVT